MSAPFASLSVFSDILFHSLGRAYHFWSLRLIFLRRGVPDTATLSQLEPMNFCVSLVT